MSATSILKNAHPVSAFSQGKASSIFNSVGDGKPALVIKNNEPYRVVITLDDYLRYEELEEDLELLRMGLLRLARDNGSGRLTQEEVMDLFGMDRAALDAIPDEEIEFE